MYAHPLPHRPEPIRRHIGWILVLASVLTALVLLLTQSPPAMPTVAAEADTSAYSELPLNFVPNVGQSEEAVRFQAHGVDSHIFFYDNAVGLSLPTADPLLMTFSGANPDVTVSGFNQLPGTTNYILGNDPAAWMTNIPTYGGITYSSLYPGIDLRYDGINGILKGTYYVAPGADPGLIRWSHNNVSQVQVVNRNLQVTLSDGDTTVVENAPVAYQMIGGRHVPVATDYVVAADGTVSLAVGHYDAGYALVIDPSLTFSTYLGGEGFEDSEGMAVDADGNIYVAGTTSSADFPLADPFQDGKAAAQDVYVAKIDPTGSTLLFSTYVGGNGDDEAYDLTLDDDGNPYVAGSTDSTDFPTASPLQAELSGPGDAFVMGLSSAGDALLYSTYLGGSMMEEAGGVAVQGGLVYVTGGTTSTDFPTANPIQPAPGGGFFDAFVAVMAPDGTAPIFSTYMGGDEVDVGVDLDVSATGTIYVTGETFSSDFPTVVPVQSQYQGNGDVFAAHVDPVTPALVYSTFLGGAGSDVPYAIAADDLGQAHLAGNTESTDFPTVAPLQAASAGGSDAFITRMSADGQALLYSTYLGGMDDDKAYGISLTPDGALYVTGDTFSSDFPTVNPLQAVHGGNADAFITLINADGSAWVYSTFLGGSESDHGDSIVGDGTGLTYVAGVTFSEDFPTVAPLQSELGGMADVFVAAIDDGGAPPPPPPGPNLNGSVKFASATALAPDELLTYTIRLHNSGTVSTTADVVDAIPDLVNYVDGSAGGGATYDPGTDTLTWDDVLVESGTDVDLTFNVTATVSVPTYTINTAVITPEGEDPIERSYTVLLVPEPLSDDTELPVVHSVIIDEGDVLTDRDVTLTISATDNVGVEYMYIREWQLVTDPVPEWVVVQSTEWIPYEESYPWTLGEVEGVHFIGVWVADEAQNPSALTRDALDYASLLVDDATVGLGAFDPYLVKFASGDEVTVTLTPTAGNADLFVWYPDHFLLPDQYSMETGTAVDEVSFTAPSDGPYIILVYGKLESTYDLAVTPAGGPRAPQPLSAAALEMLAEPIFSVAGLDPLSNTITDPPTPPAPAPDPNLLGSLKYASTVSIGPNEPLTYTVQLHNSGGLTATATVTDAIPAPLSYVDGSATGDPAYDPATNTLTWDAVTVDAYGEVRLTFVVTHAVTVPTYTVNTAVIAPDGADSFERSFPVALLPVPADGDTIPPVVHDLTIEGGDALTDPDVTLTISATDNVGVQYMYIREWVVSDEPLPMWQGAHSSGWVPYEPTYSWTLTPTNGVHVVGVWVADTALNPSFIGSNAFDYASLLLDDATVAQGGIMPYLVAFDEGDEVTITVTPSAGNPDLFVWYPGNFFLPNHFSIETTGVDEVTFTAPNSGPYIIMVFGQTAATYDMAITPAGGAASGTPLPASADGTLPSEPIFGLIGLDPLGTAEPPNGPYAQYMPIVNRP